MFTQLKHPTIWLSFVSLNKWRTHVEISEFFSYLNLGKFVKLVINTFESLGTTFDPCNGR